MRGIRKNKGPKLVLHGGKCCGIKHIYGFNGAPTDKLPALRKIRLKKDPYSNQPLLRRHDCCAATTRNDFEFFTDGAPAETYKERLDRLLAFCDQHRPYQIIEVVLVDAYHCYNKGRLSQVKLWEGMLRKRGFKKVSRAFNSNSGNYINVYHRIKEYKGLVS